MLVKAIFFILVLSVAFIIGFVTAWLYFKRKWKTPLGALQGEMLNTSSLLQKNEAEIVSLKQKLAQNKKVVSMQNDSEVTISESGMHLQAESPHIDYNVLINDNEAMMVKIEHLQKALSDCKASQQQGFLFNDADVKEKDNLKLIHGIGPFIEEKLNKIGIFNFKQISSFDSSTIEQVTNAIEFFPGRIERDKWVDQASKLYKDKKKA